MVISESVTPFAVAPDASPGPHGDGRSPNISPAAAAVVVGWPVVEPGAAVEPVADVGVAAEVVLPSLGAVVSGATAVVTAGASVSSVPRSLLQADTTSAAPRVAASHRRVDIFIASPKVERAAPTPLLR